MSKSGQKKKVFVSQSDAYAKFVEEEEDAPRLISLFNKFKEAETEAKLLMADVIPFGKYKGKTVKEIANFDSSYLEWVIKQTFMGGYPLLLEQMKSILS